MSLGACIPKRSRVATFANLTSTPREPLLFLYPSWIRSASTTPPLQQQKPSPKRFFQPKEKQKPLSVPKHAATLGEIPAVLDKRFNKPKLQSIIPSDKEAPDVEEDEDTGQLLPSRPPNITTEDGITSLSEEENMFKEITSAKDIEKMARKLLVLQKQNHLDRLSAISSRKEYQAVKREELESWVPDWRVLLATLVKHTPDHGPWLSRALEFKIPEHAEARLMHGIDDYFLEIADQHGCRMEVVSRDEVTSRFNSLVISGPATAISKCAAGILSIAPDAEILPHKESLASPEAFKLDDGTRLPGIRPHILDSQARHRYVMDAQGPAPELRSNELPPEEVPKPEEWTELSFLTYVHALTASRVTSHVNRFGLEFDKSHADRTSVHLRELLSIPEVRPFITREACNEILRYWVARNLIEDTRKVFVHMEILGLKFTPETFNILLAGAAKFNDLHNFHFVLHLMLNRGITPNGRTWTHFMVAFSDVKVKLHIVTAMQKKGLLNHPRTMLEASAQIAGPEIKSSLQKEQTQAEFIAHMDSRYGSMWLNNSSANHIINEIASNGLISRCWEFLHFMESRGVVPDKYCINTILYHCKQTDNLRGAVEILRSLPKSMKFEPCEETFRLMFDLAWSLKHYNVAKVVWRYSCLAGATSYKIRERVWESMKSSNLAKPPKRDTPRYRWSRTAGPVIIGLNDISEHPSRYLEREVPEMELERLLGRVRAREVKEHRAEEKKARIAKAIGDELSEMFESEASECSEGISTFSPLQASHKEDIDPTEPATDPDDYPSPDPITESLPPPMTPDELAAHRASPSYQTHLQQRTLPQILDPWGPSIVGNRLPTYKKPILLDLFYSDLKMFLHWKPVRPFEESLIKALEIDAKWCRRNDLKDKEVKWLVRHALSVKVRSLGRVDGVVREFDWF
ncbi:hypothetical protein VTL71DRAFT_10951 [Oculimacula yallundae]|uniref:Pentatricopeptide repeat-containing protein n=1 Tax=Oculimacula yallundae TaxID=86028 RepID=A0ABR4CUK5_9HELO